MDSIPEHKILKFKSDLLFVIRKMYNLDKPGQMDEAINLLEDWLKKEEHILKKDFPRNFLERVIIFHKGSLERSKASINNLCLLKTLHPEFFNKYDAKKEYKYINRFCSFALLPKLTKDNYRVGVAKFWIHDYSSDMFLDFYKFSCLFSEYTLANDYFVGVIAIIDFRGVKISNILTAINLAHVDLAIKHFAKGCGYRLKAIHVITSNTIDLLLKTIMKVLPRKISNRILVHTELDTLYEHVPKEILPTELNGDERSLNILFDEWLDVLSTNENVAYLKEIFTKAVVDKSSKQLTEFKEIYGGLDGTFRSLNVD